jgi:hypothetical protein
LNSGSTVNCPANTYVFVGSYSVEKTGEVVDPVPDAFTAKVPVPDCSEGVYTIAYACPEKLDGVSIVNVVVEFIPVIIAALDPHSNIPPSIAFVM